MAPVALDSSSCQASDWNSSGSWRLRRWKPLLGAWGVGGTLPLCSADSASCARRPSWLLPAPGSHPAQQQVGMHGGKHTWKWPSNSQAGPGASRVSLLSILRRPSPSSCTAQRLYDRCRTQLCTATAKGLPRLVLASRLWKAAARGRGQRLAMSQASEPGWASESRGWVPEAWRAPQRPRLYLPPAICSTARRLPRMIRLSQLTCIAPVLPVVGILLLVHTSGVLRQLKAWRAGQAECSVCGPHGCMHANARSIFRQQAKQGVEG